MKKKIMPLLLAALIGTAFLTSCGDGAEPKVEESVSKTEETAAPDTVSETETETEASVTETEPEIEIVKPTVKKEVVFGEDFETGTSGFGPRGGETVKIIDEGYNSSKCLIVTDRTATWNGASVDITDCIKASTKYEVRAMMKYEGGPATKKVYVSLQQNTSSYITCGQLELKRGEWNEVSGVLDIPANFDSECLYFESEYKDPATEDDLVDLYIDDVKVYYVEVENADVKLPSLYEKHEDYFKIGLGTGARELRDPTYYSIILNQFNSITMGNEMKPDSVLDYVKCSNDPEKYNLEPAIKTDNLEVGLKFAKKNGITVRLHVLVWHQQTPEWFFKENYSRDANAAYVSKEVMTQRLENYIKAVLTYCNENYPGIVYAVDVVNEAINIGEGNSDGIRTKDNHWYDVIGPDYVELAFTFARKYAAEDMKLFYNDYNCHSADRRLAMYNLVKGLKEKGLIDGMGFQSHYGLASPSTIEIQETLLKFAELDLELQVTELDINTADNSDEGFEKLAVRYKKLINLYRSLVDKGLANITSITIWGLTDENSWLNDTEKKYPALFDEYLMPKEAYWGFYQHSSIANY